jgi:hypothetical protein
VLRLRLLRLRLWLRLCRVRFLRIFDTGVSSTGLLTVAGLLAELLAVLVLAAAAAAVALAFAYRLLFAFIFAFTLGV